MNLNNIKQLKKLTENSSSNEVLSSFLKQQIIRWPLASDNYKGLEKVREREFSFDGFVVKVQFNPERIRSSAAKVDDDTIKKRKCFLCLDNLPPQQDGILFDKDYIILVNPFPILKEHFTIPRIDHVDQSFMNNVESMLSLVSHMQGYTLFYNGPKCGASAPDHMHFQAGQKGFMPVEREYNLLKNSQAETIVINEKVEIRAFNNYLRKMISIESSDALEVLKAVEEFYKIFAQMQPQESEPMLNAVCTQDEGKYIMHLFPRKLHRPAQYFAQGADQILISPASVDFGGVFITPRLEDFEKITREDIVDIFNQVSVDDEQFDKLKQACKFYYLV